MAIGNRERHGPDDRTSLRPHFCDGCGACEKTPLVRLAPNPPDWIKLEVRQGAGAVEASADLCPTCWADKDKRDLAAERLWALWEMSRAPRGPGE